MFTQVFGLDNTEDKLKDLLFQILCKILLF